MFPRLKQSDDDIKTAEYIPKVKRKSGIYSAVFCIKVRRLKIDLFQIINLRMHILHQQID